MDVCEAALEPQEAARWMLNVSLWNVNTFLIRHVKIPTLRLTVVDGDYFELPELKPRQRTAEGDWLKDREQ